MSDKPNKVDQKLATTCTKCRQRVLTAYGMHSDDECVLNAFQAMVDKEDLRWTPLNEDMVQLLATEHNLPIYQLKFNASNGALTGVFVSKWVLEAIATYNSMQMADMTLAEFLVIMSGS